MLEGRKEEEEVLAKKKQELKDFMTRRIAHLIEEHKNRSKLFNTRDPDFEVARTLKAHRILKYLFQMKKKGYP